MTDEELDAALKRGSKKWFVKCYAAHEGHANGNLSKTDWMAALEAAGCPKAHGWSWRTPLVRIFEAGREEDALRIIINSGAEPDVRVEAQRLLDEM